jgi:hypothetical protein
MKEGRDVKKTVMILFVAVVGITLVCGVAMAEMMGDLNALAKNELAPIGHNAKIVNWTKEKNAQGETMAQIDTKDKAWKAEEGVADYMKPYLEGSCANYLRKIVSMVPYLSEIFVMDNQGALVCETDKTGDYMQGDEAKWQKSYANGNGAIFVDEPEMDEAFGQEIVQISVPVMDGMHAIGAITFGVFPKKAM